MRRLAAEPWREKAVATKRQVAPNNSRVNGQDPQPPVRSVAIARRISKHPRAKSRILDRRRCGNLVLWLKVNNALAGGLHSHLQNLELIAVKADERITLGSQIVEPYFRGVTTNAQVGNR